MAHYTVIKFVPDPVKDESINVGVIAFAGNEVAAQLTDDFARARSFAKRDPSSLRAVLADFRQMLDQGQLTEAKIRRMAESWQNQVQLTIPRASTQPVAALLDEVAPLFLPEAPATAPVQRLGKRRAVKLAVDSLTTRITSRFNTSRSAARRLIKLDYEAPGRLEQHELDLALVNGALKLGALALSFARENRAQIKRDMDAAAFAVEDIRSSNRRLPLVILGYRADAGNADLQRAANLFGNWNVPVVTENRIEQWSRSVVNDLPQNVLHD